MFERDEINDNMAERIRRARLSRGWTQRELGLQTGIPLEKIAKYEAGSIFITDDAISKISRATKIHPAFFFRSLSVNVTEIAFQNNVNLRERDKSQIIESIKERGERLTRALAMFDTPQIPKFKNKWNKKINSTEEAAQLSKKLIEDWGVTPKTNLIKLIESKGILFFGINNITAGFDGVLVKIDDIPAIAANMKNMLEQRRSIAHELAHLFGIKNEDFCDTFSLEFIKDIDDDEPAIDSDLLETLVYRAFDEERISHSIAARLLGISQIDFQDEVERRCEIAK